MADDEENKAETVAPVATNDLIFHYNNEDDDDINDKETAKLLKNGKLSESESTQSVEEYPGTVYKRRWLMLLIFSFNTGMNALLFVSVSAINDIVRKYYNVPSTTIEWLSNMCMLTYPALSLPSSYVISRCGIRPVLIAIAICQFIATVLQFTGYRSDRFYLVVVGQVFAAIAISSVLQMPGKLSSTWFPKHERATATSIGVVMNLVGVAIGFAQPVTIVTAPSDASDTVESQMKMFYITRLFVASFIMVMTCFYQEKPPSPPCSSSQRERLPLLKSLTLLWRNKYFIFLSQSYAIYYGLFCSLFVLLNPLVTAKYPVGKETSIGWMGFWNIMVSIVSFVGLGRLLDKFHKYQLTAVALNLSSMLIWLIFVLVMKYTNTFTAIYTIYVLFGMCFLPYFAVGIEQAAEMTYPVSEETSSTILLMLANIYAFVFIIVFGHAVQLHYANIVEYVMVGLYFISTLMAVMAKTDLNRLAAEEKTVP